MIHRVLLVVIGLWASAVACQQVGESSKTQNSDSSSVKIINGVERSELALLMRDMYDEMKLVGDSIEQGVPVRTDYLKKYIHMHDADPTEPEKIDDIYHGMATAFLESYARFESADSNKLAAFNLMIEHCMACHQQKCPGPVKAIKRLRIPTSVSQTSL